MRCRIERERPAGPSPGALVGRDTATTPRGATAARGSRATRVARALVLAAGLAMALGACAGRGSRTDDAGLATATRSRAPNTPDRPRATPRHVGDDAGSPVLLRGARVMTAAGTDYPKADILLRGGTIAAVGVAIVAPAGAQIVDLAGKTITPGIIDTHSHLGVYASPTLNAHSDGNEIVAPIAPHVRAADGYWPQDPQLQRARAGGVTTLQILPGSANLIGGRSVVVKTYPNARHVGDARFPGAPAGLKMACGENPKRVYADKGGPSTRMGNMAGFRAAFQAAAEYRRSWTRYHAQARGAGGRPHNAEGQKDAESPPDRDFGLETLVGVLEGRILVHNHCYRADEMALMLQLADDFGFRIRSFHHAAEAYKVADLLAAHGAAASVWADWWGFKAEAFDGIRENAAMVSAAGARAIIHSDSAEGIQRLNQEAAKAMWAGRRAGIAVADNEALRWITANPAWALGVSDKVGTIEVGKSADLTIWDGDPFSVYTHAERVIIEGKAVYVRGSLTPHSDFESGWRSAPSPVSTSPSVASHRPNAASASRSAGGPTAKPGALSFDTPSATEGIATDPATTVAYTGCTIHIGDGRVLTHAGIRTQGSRIAEVGPLPTAAEATTPPQPCVITPGFIAASSALGLVEISAEDSTKDDHRDDPHPIRAGYDASVAVNAQSSLLSVNRIDGVTSAAVTPSGGLLAGQVAWIDLVTGAHRTIVSRPRIAVAGTLSTEVWGGSRAAALSLLERTFQDARFYRSRRAAYDRGASRELAAHPADLAALWPVLDGKARLVMQAHRASDILALIDLSQRLKVPLTIVGATQAHAVAHELAQAGVVVVVQPSRNLPTHLDRLGARLDNAALLHAAGVTVAIATIGSAHNARNVAQEVGIAIAHGLPRQAAVQAVTLNVAKAYGMDDAYGSLTPGKVANFVVWRGDPFELSVVPQAVILRGGWVPLTSRQTELRDRYRDLSTFGGR